MTVWDQFIDSIERRKKQLDDVVTAYRTFREKLDALPPEIAQEAKSLLDMEAVARVGTESFAMNEQATVTKKDMAGMSSLDCVRVILTENDNQPMHYSAIAKAAIARGYRGRKSGTPDEVEGRTTNSFWAAMSRATWLNATGNGYYQLREAEFATAQAMAAAAATEEESEDDEA